MSRQGRQPGRRLARGILVAPQPLQPGHHAEAKHATAQVVQGIGAFQCGPRAGLPFFVAPLQRQGQTQHGPRQAGAIRATAGEPEAVVRLAA
ncbi:hypothetical protein D3C72_1615050 [compost metagenome]